MAAHYLSRFWRTWHRCSVTLSAVLQPVTPPDRVDASHFTENPEALILVTVDCVCGLPNDMEENMLTFRASVQSGNGQSTNVTVSTAPRCAVSGAAHGGTRQDAIGLSGRWPFVRERILFLRSRGVNLSPAEISWMFPGELGPEQAAQLLAELDLESTSLKSAAAAQGGGPTKIEALFEEQLRLQISGPGETTLRVDLWDEAENKSVGNLTWTSLSWLAEQKELEDKLREYPLKNFSGKSSAVSCPTMFLKRQLIPLQPVQVAPLKDVVPKLPRHPSAISEGATFNLEEAL